MKKNERKSLTKETLDLLPPEKDATGDIRIYRDFKDKPDEESILYFEDSKKDLLIRETLEKDINVIKTFQSRQVQVIARKYGSLQKIKSSQISGKLDIVELPDESEFSILIFKKSTNTLLAMVDVKCLDFENHGTVQFLFNPSVRSKYRKVVKNYFSEFLVKYNIMKNVIETPNILEKEYGVTI